MRGSVSARWRRLYPALGRRLRSPTRGTDQPNAARLTREGELSTHRSRRQCTARLFDRRPEKTLRGCTRRRGDSQDAPTERPSRTVALLSNSNGRLPLHRGTYGHLPIQPSESYCNRASSGTGGDLGCSGPPVFTNSQIQKFESSDPPQLGMAHGSKNCSTVGMIEGGKLGRLGIISLSLESSTPNHCAIGLQRPSHGVDGMTEPRRGSTMF